ncbi:MAG: 50S ribosomal protein L5, partial [Promethearchaeota archaeon]
MSSKAKTKKQKSINYDELWESNPMKKPFLEKIVLNIGVGAGGEELERAVTVLETISNMQAIKTLSKINIKEF